jgi:PAS domain S-box-containing protein
MQFLNRKELVAGVVLLIACLLANAVVSYSQTEILHTHARWVTHTHEVLTALESVIGGLARCESNQRGYIINGGDAFLESYSAERTATLKAVDAVTTLTSDNPGQQARIARLKQRIADRLEVLDRSVELRRSGGFDDAQTEFAAGERRLGTTPLLSLTGEMQQEEESLLATRERDNERAYQSLLYSTLFGLLLALAAVGAFLWLFKRYLGVIAKTTATIQEQRELLRAMLTSIGDGVIATDREARVTLLNDVAQQLTGWSDADAQGRPLDEVFRIINEETRQPVENPARRALLQGRITGLANHTILISRDGGEWPIDDSAAPVRDANGEVGGAILVFREIRERKRQEVELRHQASALREADRRKDEFLATLSHELRNPLAPLSNALQIWPRVEGDPAQMEELRQLMERQVAQLTRLVDDLLDVSRITRGKIDLRKQPVDLQTVVQGAVEAVEPLTTASRHSLTLDLPDEPLLVMGDVARLTQVFANVLHNAVKYTGRDGKICVTAGTRDGTAIVAIRDNGPGIPADMLARVFDLFQQVDQTLERSHGGLGIGLTLVKRLVTLHGGSVEARSDGPDQGSEFIITLPALRSGQLQQTADQPQPEAGSSSCLPRLKILVVDDVQASAKTLALMLKSIGQEVSTLSDGAAVAEWVRGYDPDVVFLDIAMPGMSGYDVARQIRNGAGAERPYLIALTGYGQDDDRRRALAAGFNYHLTKPASIERLERLLRTRPHGESQPWAGGKT